MSSTEDSSAPKKSRFKLNPAAASWSPDVSAPAFTPGGAPPVAPAVAPPVHEETPSVAESKAVPVSSEGEEVGEGKVEEKGPEEEEASLEADAAAAEAAEAEKRAAEERAAAEAIAAEEEAAAKAAAEEEKRAADEARAKAEAAAAKAAASASASSGSAGGGGGGGGGGGAAGGGGGSRGGDGGDPYAYKKATVEVPPPAEDEDAREHLSIVFIGHVDAGKSTLSGNILYLTEMVDQRTIDKYTREAKTKNRESWFLAFIMDIDDDEREKGKTVEVGRAHFETKSKRITILDAPGHKSYVPNMIQGASQADVAVLVISARRGEFETGFDRGGQTREHALLAKTLGVSRLVVAVNKMDEPTVEWDKERFDEIKERLQKFLRETAGFKKKYIEYVPISALTGDNVKERSSKCDWYDGPSLIELLDGVKIPSRDDEAALRMPISDRYGDRGVIAIGKVEVGIVFEGMPVVLQPTGMEATIETIWLDDDTEVKRARSGEACRVRLKGVTEADVHRGFVICDPGAPAPTVKKFQAQLMLQDLGEKIFTAGYSAVLHLHTIEEEVTVNRLLTLIDKKTGEVKQSKPKFIKSKGACTAVLSVPQSIACEKYSVIPQLGRFSIRDEGKTIAIGVVTGLPKPK